MGYNYATAKKYEGPEKAREIVLKEVAEVIRISPEAVKEVLRTNGHSIGENVSTEKLVGATVDALSEDRKVVEDITKMIAKKNTVVPSSDGGIQTEGLNVAGAIAGAVGAVASAFGAGQKKKAAEEKSEAMSEAQKEQTKRKMLDMIQQQGASPYVIGGIVIGGIALTGIVLYKVLG